MLNTPFNNQASSNLKNLSTNSLDHHSSNQFNPQLNTHTELIDCKYCNHESRIQIVRLSEPSWAYLEKVVMPNQSVYFRAPANALLEIHEATMAGSTHADTIPCAEIRVSIEPLCTEIPSRKTMQINLQITLPQAA